MTPDRWQTLVERLDDAKQIESRTTEELEGKPGTVELVIVKTPLGRIRLSWSSQPKRLADKALYSKRGGSTVNIEVKYDESETIHVFHVERADPATGKWIPVDPEHFQM